MNISKALAVALCAVMLVGAVGLGGAVTGKTVQVDSVGTLQEGTSDSTTLTAYNVEDADGVGSYELNISYDDSTVDISVSGNSRFDVETTDHGNGTVTVVGYTGETSGTTGNISLADITVTAQSVDSNTSADITVTVEDITDTKGNDLSHTGGVTTVEVAADTDDGGDDGDTPPPSGGGGDDGDDGDTDDGDDDDDGDTGTATPTAEPGTTTTPSTTTTTAGPTTTTTAGPTTTTTAGPTTTTTTSPTTTTSSTGIPGFGTVVAVVALVAVSLIALRRD
ncbi:PGF-CTERM sorting domain-containing protein [Haloferax sp. S1W]|uniref:PGF-CTERM sorting domain-containing protein n=1 Tax=Haloferax sp. S1W TaxID=3377110 RepID=UPI0037C96CF5